MNKLKEWLQITYPSGTEMAQIYDEILEKIEELNKPLEVPKELFDWLEERKPLIGVSGSMFSMVEELYDFSYRPHSSLEFAERIKKLSLIQVVTGQRGYSLKNELFVVKVPHTDHYYAKLMDYTLIGIGNPAHVEQSDHYHFTEKEILHRLPGVPKEFWINVDEI